VELIGQRAESLVYLYGTTRPGSTSSPTSAGLLSPTLLTLGFSGQALRRRPARVLERPSRHELRPGDRARTEQRHSGLLNGVTHVMRSDEWIESLNPDNLTPSLEPFAEYGNARLGKSHFDRFQDLLRTRTKVQC
jgi:hypothetical protein